MSKLTVLQEHVLTFVNKSVKRSVDQIFNSDSEGASFVAQESRYRLDKVGTHVTLGVYSMSVLGEYLKPIGLYDQFGSLVLLNEYVSTFNNLKSKGIQVRSVEEFSLLQNALVSAFSMDNAGVALNILREFEEFGLMPKFHLGHMIPGIARYDRKIQTNGLKGDFIMCTEGYVQYFLEDNYGLEAPLAAFWYTPENQSLTIKPIMVYNEIFQNLLSLKLLAFFNRTEPKAVFINK